MYIRKLMPWSKPPIDFDRVDSNLEKAKSARDRLKQRKNLEDPIIRRFYGYYPEKREEVNEQG